MKCQECRFFDDPPGGQVGYCHRNAPGWHDGGWPQVARTDWCGEFQFNPDRKITLQDPKRLVITRNEQIGQSPMWME